MFCAVAVAHTLYAPRPVILWNVRRILLLGVSLALAIGCDYVFVILIPLVLGVMWYLAPMRKLDALLILLASCLVTGMILLAAYNFHPQVLLDALAQAKPFGPPKFPGGSEGSVTLPELWFLFRSSLVAAPIALVVAFTWKKSRYFGNLGPLCVAAVFIATAAFVPISQGFALWFAALSFLCQLVGGVAADLLETRARTWLLPALVAVLVFGMAWNLSQGLRWLWA